MTKFCLICWDKPGSTQKRSAIRNDHLDYINTTKVVCIAGPLTSEDKQTMIGSMIILEVANREEAQNWAKNDPYQKSGLFDRVEIHPWIHAVGTLPLQE